jgi:hypothetical protein
VKRDAYRVRDHGRRNRIQRLTEERWPAEESDGWEVTAVAVHVTGAQAAYRTEDATGITFFLLNHLRPAPYGFVPDHSGDSK